MPLYSPRPARLSDVISFLNEEIDDEKLHNLIWGLLGVEQDDNFVQPDCDEVGIPFEFGLPRLLIEESCFIQDRDHWHLSDKFDANAKPDPDVFSLLMSGQRDAVQQCVDRAARRLKSYGLLVNGYRNRQRSGKPIAVISRIPPERLLASMLFPLSNRDLERIANSVLYPPEMKE
jgi:CRISPR-associated protein Csx17